jgi:hypothetical protein
MSELSVQQPSRDLSLVAYSFITYAKEVHSHPCKFAGGIRGPNKFLRGQEHVYPYNEESFLDYASYAAFLSYTERKRERGGGEGREERELSRLYVVTNLSWLCKKPALITRRNQETSSDCAGERVCVLLRCLYVPSSRHGVDLISQIFSESENITTSYIVVATAIS